jgi:CheY-like chemotaxis protein
LLENLNYRTMAVDSAKSALQILAAGTQIDVVFSDIMLPGDLDGVALAEAIGKRYPRLPVLLTSGYAKALSGRHGLPILRKPYQISALAEAMRTTIAGQSASETQARLL